MLSTRTTNSEVYQAPKAKKSRTKKEATQDNGTNGQHEETQVEKSTRHLETMIEKASTTATPRITLPPMDVRIVDIPVIGDTPLIVHQFSQKARQMMLDKQMGRASAGKENKDPVQDFVDSLYIMRPGKLVVGEDKERSEYQLGDEVSIEGGTFGFPCLGFKNAMVTACTSVGKSAISKVQARQAFHLEGQGSMQLVPIRGHLRMRDDMVRLQGTTADIRFRGEFFPWMTTLTIKYNARVLTAEQIANLLNIAGFGVGVGEWRPEKDGQFGMWHVASTDEAEAFNAMMEGK